MRIFLLRHGQTIPNLTGAIDTTTPGSPLTMLGLRQAMAIPAAFADEKIDALVSSTLLRTQLTIAPLADALGLKVMVAGGIREILGGDFETLSDAIAQESYLAIAFAWARGDLRLRMPGAESGVEFFDRYDRVLQEVFERGIDTAAVVSHGSAIRTWVASRATNLDPDFAGSNHLDNTGCAVLEGTGLHDLQLVEWRSSPAGGAELNDPTATYPAGELLEHPEPAG